MWCEGSVSSRHNVGDGLDYVHSFGSRTVLDVNAASINYYTNSVDPGFAQNPPSSIGLPSYLDAKTSSYPLLPSINWSGWTGFAPAIGPGITTDRILSIKADVIHEMTRHSLKAGVDFRGQYFSGFSPGNNAGALTFVSTYTQRTDDAFQSAGNGAFGGSWAAFMMGLPTTASADINASSVAFNPFLGGYVQ